MNQIHIYNKLEGVGIILDDTPIDIAESRRVDDHSFAFGVGHGGSGPSQTALAILLRFTDKETAQRLKGDFRNFFVKNWRPNKTYYVDIPLWIQRKTEQ
jgi:hypothetical protein